MSKISIEGNASGTGTLTIAAPNTNSNYTLTLPEATGTVVARSSTYIAPSELGSGTANDTTFLRGDNTWQTISTTPTTDQVLTATAGASVGAVGTYAFMVPTASITYTQGATRAGSGLRYSSVYSVAGDSATVNNGSTAAGTWRVMGSTGGFGSVQWASVWLRIS